MTTPTSTSLGSPPPSAPVRHSAPALAPGVELLGELAGSGYRDAPSLVRRGDGQTLQVTPLLYALLSLVDGRRDEAALATALGQQLGRHVEPSDVHCLVEDKLVPMGLLGDADGAAPEVAKANPLLALRWKVVVTDPAVTRRITTPFAQLFRTWIVVPVLLVFAATTWWVLAERGLGAAAREALYEPHLLLAVVAITVLSAGFHEFGHAAACRYGGADPGAMGAGLYIVWPAFYTDVDSSYRLSRWGRLRVDLGGLYFNAVFSVAVVGLWLVFRQDALLLGVAAQLVQMVRQLAPFIRADGYHILADLTGVPDLFAHMKPTLLALLPWRWGRSTGTPLKRWARVVVSAWVLIVAPLLVGLLVLTVLILPRLVATAWDSLDSQGGSLGEDFATGDVVSGLARLLSLLGLVLPVAACVYLLSRIVQRTWRATARATEDRPKARGAAAVAATLLLALVAWAWWPQGQYTPVSADERGTLSVPRLPGQAPVLASTVPVGTRTALALVPRGEAAASNPTLLLLRPAPGQPLQAVVAPDSTGTVGAGTTFPFRIPEAASEGDTQAVALGTDDGKVVYDVAVARVTITDGSTVDNRNQAFALASCRACTTVGVAFQVVLIVGQSDTVVPVNTAVAANANCVECLTRAFATQLVVTLRSLPSADVERQIDEALARLGALDGSETGLSAGDLLAEVNAVQAEIVGILERGGLVEPGSLTTTTTTASPSPAGSAAPSASPGTTTSTPATPATPAAGDPSSGPSPSGEPQPTSGASSGPSQQPSAPPSSGPTATTSDAPSPTTSP